MTRIGLVAAAAVAVAGTASAQGRDQIQIAGSSTVLPYAQIVAENFGEEFPEFSTVVESGGSSGGLRRFCEGVGTQYIDIANSSRSIRDTEVTACAGNGVTDILEVRFGYDGIVFAYDVNAPALEFTPIDVYRALASEIMVDGQKVANPNATMQDVQGEYPSWPIAFYVPASNHGTREVFEEKVLLQGCQDIGDFDAFQAAGMSEDDAEEACITMRDDGAVTEIAGDYTETLARIDANRQGFGVFGLSFYENNRDKLQVAPMNGVVPSEASVATGEYPVSRPLFFYVKTAHLEVIPGMCEYVNFFASDAMTGPGSPTVNYGLVPAPSNERSATQAAIAEYCPE